MKTKTLIAGLALAGMFGAGLALPGAAAADSHWRGHDSDRYSWRDRSHGWDHDRYRNYDRYHRYRGWDHDYDHRPYGWGYYGYPHWEPLFYPDGSIRLWIYLGD